MPGRGETEGSAGARTRGPDGAPGPKGLPFLGNMLQMRGVDPLAFWIRTHAEHGDAVKLKAGPLDIWSFASPQAVHDVLVTRHRDMRKGMAYGPLKMLLGEGLITTDRDHWAHQRRTLNPVFAPAAIEAASGALLAACRAGVEELRPLAETGEETDLGEAMTRLTMRVVSRAAFGVDFGLAHGEVGRAFDLAFAFVADITADPLRLPLFVPTARNRAYRRARARIDAFTDELVARSGVDAGSDSLYGPIAMALSGTDRQRFRDEVVTLYFAGFETTARSMTFMIDLLARHPDALAALRREVDAIDGLETLDSVLRRLPVATEIVNETLRLYPPVAMVARQPARDCEIAGHAVRAGSLVILCPFIVQRDPRHWPAGERFAPDPSRPLAQRLTHRGAFAPFGGGPRLCLGKHFAMLELVLALALIARAFEWRLGEEAPPQLAFHGTLRPRKPIRARFSPRRPGG